MTSAISCSNESHSLTISGNFGKGNWKNWKRKFPIFVQEKISFDFFQKFFGLFCLRPTASHIMRRNEESFLVQLLDEEAVLPFHHHCLSVCFFVFFYISGEPKLYIDFKRPEQWLITFPSMFSIPSLIISKILCTF